MITQPQEPPYDEKRQSPATHEDPWHLVEHGKGRVSGEGHERCTPVIQIAWRVIEPYQRKSIEAKNSLLHLVHLPALRFLPIIPAGEMQEPVHDVACHL